MANDDDEEDDENEDEVDKKAVDDEGSIESIDGDGDRDYDDVESRCSCEWHDVWRRNIFYDVRVAMTVEWGKEPAFSP